MTMSFRAVEWVEADAEDLRFADVEFDVVMSCIGAMFAPDHQRTADELLQVCKQAHGVDHFADAEQFCAYYKANFGPTIAAYASLADEPGRVAALDRDFLDYAITSNVSEPGRPAAFEFDYLLLVARRSG